MLLHVALLVGLLHGGFCDISTSPSPPVVPVHNQQDTSLGYIPHTTYLDSELFPEGGYSGYLVPAGSLHPEPSSVQDTSVQTRPLTALEFALKIFAKVGLFLVGGVALLLVGGIFTTAVCSLTPICTITYNGFGSINKGTVRSFVTPDRISAAADFVQDSIKKYHQLQRTANK